MSRAISTKCLSNILLTHTCTLQTVSIGYCSRQEKALQKGAGNQEQAPSLSQMAALLAAASAFIIINNNNVKLYDLQPCIDTTSRKFGD